MSEARKIFPMDTFVAYLKGEGTASVAEMLTYMTQKDLDADSTPFAAALAKAWIYEQHPELTKMSKGQMVELGQSVSVAPMPVKAKAEVDEVFAKLADYKGQINAKGAKIDELTKALAAKDAENCERKQDSPKDHAKALPKGTYEGSQGKGSKQEGQADLAGLEASHAFEVYLNRRSVSGHEVAPGEFEMVHCEALPLLPERDD